jgi:uncharacterized membrane protein YdbT with pleckstrin-like domain
MHNDSEQMKTDDMIAPSSSDESTVWRGSSSGVINLGTYLIWALGAGVVIALGLFINPLIFAGLVLPLGGWGWAWLANRCRVYEVTNERLKISTGVFTRRTEELELYRVKDTSLIEPLLYRLFGAGNVVLTSADESTPSVTLEAVPNARGLREEIRRHVEVRRDRKRVRFAEIDDPSPGDGH